MSQAQAVRKPAASNAKQKPPIPLKSAPTASFFLSVADVLPFLRPEDLIGDYSTLEKSLANFAGKSCSLQTECFVGLVASSAESLAENLHFFLQRLNDFSRVLLPKFVCSPV